MKLNIKYVGLVFSVTRYSHPSQSTVSISVTPSSPLLMGEGIKDVLRSFMAGSRDPPTVLTELDSSVGLDLMWQ